MVRRRRAWLDITSFGHHTQTNDVRRGMPSWHWVAHTVERHRAWHAIIALGRQTRSNNVRHDMPLPPLDSTHGRTTSGVAFHHHLWATHMIERRRAWHAITSFGQITRSSKVVCEMPSPLLDFTFDRMTSGVACYHRLKAAQTVEQCWARHDLTALGLHARSETLGVA